MLACHRQNINDLQRTAAEAMAARDVSLVRDTAAVFGPAD
jgi:hypothetical protein